MEEAARQTGAFKVHENTIEIQFPKRAPEAAQKPAQAEKPAEKAAGSKQPAAKKAAEPEKKVEPAPKETAKAEPVKPASEPKTRDAAHLGWLPGGGRDVSIPGDGKLCPARAAQKSAEKAGTSPDLPVEGETFEFPAVGGYAVPPQIEDTNPIEPVQPIEPERAGTTCGAKDTGETEESAEAGAKAAGGDALRAGFDAGNAGAYRTFCARGGAGNPHPAGGAALCDADARRGIRSGGNISAGEAAPSKDGGEGAPRRLPSGGRNARPRGGIARLCGSDLERGENISQGIGESRTPRRSQRWRKPQRSWRKRRKSRKRSPSVRGGTHLAGLGAAGNGSGGATGQMRSSTRTGRRRRRKKRTPPPPKKKEEILDHGRGRAGQRPGGQPAGGAGRSCDDYRKPSDAPSVAHELGSSLRELTLRLAVTGIITVLLLVLGVLGEMTRPAAGAIRGALADADGIVILNLIFSGDCLRVLLGDHLQRDQVHGPVAGQFRQRGRGCGGCGADPERGAALLAGERGFVQRPRICGPGVRRPVFEHSGQVLAHQAHPAQFPLCRVAGPEIRGAVFRRPQHRASNGQGLCGGHARHRLSEQDGFPQAFPELEL